MTKRDLKGLLAERDAALKAHRRPVPWSTLTPDERAEEEAIIAQHERAEAAIVAFLQTQTEPVPVGKVMLHLTGDRAGFVELDKASGCPLHMGRGQHAVGGWHNLLYDYARQCNPEIVP